MGQVLFISNLPEFRKFFIPLHPLILETHNKTELMAGFFRNSRQGNKLCGGFVLRHGL